MKLFVMTDTDSDFLEVLKSCSVDVKCSTFSEALHADLAAYDAYCILPSVTNIVLDARLRKRLETEVDKGKRLFGESLGSFGEFICASLTSTVRHRLVCITEDIPGIACGDLLDDMANRAGFPEVELPDMKPLLVYKEQIIAHAHTSLSREEVMNGAKYGLWQYKGNVLVSAFCLHHFNKARFAPRAPWEALIRYIAAWITGNEPTFIPAPILHYGPPASLPFETARKEAVARGIDFIRSMLVDDGKGGAREGLSHAIDKNGSQATAACIRTDCTGECAGALRLYAAVSGDTAAKAQADALEDFVFDVMQVKGGICDGMLRWTEHSFGACYQDDAARAMLPTLYACAYHGQERHFDDACRALDFLVATTAKDGTRVPRTNSWEMNEETVAQLHDAEHGCISAHYNAYYHAALLLAYVKCRKAAYLDTAVKGLETLMAAYPETRREHSETQEYCRLILPLAVLYAVTGKETHKAFLYRVANDLQKFRHKCGGYCEWDTGYKATRSRESTTECSLLTENGDPVADMLYSSNWLPLGFALAYRATGDAYFEKLWKDSVTFCIRTQIVSADKRIDGSWCRAFDMDRWEAYACPHDVGWAACASESGWTDAEILMGMMLPSLWKKE